MLNPKMQIALQTFPLVSTSCFRWSSSGNTTGRKQMNVQNRFNPPTSSDGSWTCLDVDLGAISHQGHVRENNEDSYLVMRFGRSLENLLTNIDPDLLDALLVSDARLRSNAPAKAPTRRSGSPHRADSNLAE